MTEALPRRGSEKPFNDIFHEALRPTWDQNVTHLQSIFAAGAMADIYDIAALRSKAPNYS